MGRHANALARDGAWSVRLMVVMAVSMAAARVWLSYCWVLQQVWWAPADDGLFAREAIGGAVHDQLTMAKRPGYTWFLRIVHASHMPLTVWIACVWAAAALAVAWAVWRIGNRRRLPVAVAFILTLWCPVGFDSQIGQRAYRGSVLSPAVLLLAAGLVAAFAARGWVERLAFSTVAGVAAGCVWLMKEDALWIVPMTAVALLACLVRSLTGRQHRLLMAVALLPALLLPAGADAAARQYELHAHGVAMLDTRTEGELAAFAGRVYRIESPDRTYKRWTTDDALDKALNAAPDLEPLRPYLMEGMYRINHGDDKGIWGDYLTWQLRYAITAAAGGRWPSETSLQSRFANANRLLDEAEERGDFTYDDGPSPGTLVSPLPWETIRSRVLPAVAPAMAQNVWPTSWTAPRLDDHDVGTGDGALVKARYLEYVNEDERPQRHVTAAVWTMRAWRVLAVSAALWALAGTAAALRRLRAEAFVALAFTVYAVLYTFAECWFLVFLDGGEIWTYVVGNTMPLVVVSLAVGMALPGRCTPGGRHTLGVGRHREPVR